MKRFACTLLIALSMLLLLMPVASASGSPCLAVSDEAAAAANLFLSNFTETGIRSCGSASGDMSLVDFAHDHLWFNDHSAYEFGEYGAENNCRVSDERIQEIIDKYFLDAPIVDLAQTRFDYIDGYYYHCETGGWTADGFAHVLSICSAGENQYFVSFLIYGGGSDWDNSVMDDSIEEIEAAFGAPTGCGSALIYADDLSDRSAYLMISYARV